MTLRSEPDPDDSSTSAALGAFLRGVDRRGLVFAWLLSGSRGTGRQALDWTLERFRGEAGRVPFGDWPRHFWALLLAAPALRQPPREPHWEPGFAWLSGIGHGPRAALLLRVVAGLAESDAATVLGTSRATYRLGLQRALPHRADGSPDVEAWEALGRAAQELVRNPLPAPSEEPAPAPAPDRESGGAAWRPATRGVRAALVLVAVGTMLAFAATFVAEDRLPEGLDEAPGHILVEPLGDAAEPARRYDRDEALALHPDLELLLDTASPDAAAADPAFHAWWLAEARNGAAPDASAGEGPVARQAVVPEAGGQGPRAEAAAQRPARQRLAALDPAALAALDRRREAWDALPPAERGERRERWLAWRDLASTERAALRGAARRYAALPQDEQAALRARFDDLDASVRRGWLLGPDLGADYPRLHPLIAQVPAEARAAVLEALRGLDRQARDDLAVLAARTAPQSRAELRVELLATPPAQRGRWLRERVAPPPTGVLR